MQAPFEKDAAAIKAFRATVSEARFTRYLRASKHDAEQAVKLYHWNALLSQSLYLPLQVWEVALRNKLNDYLKLRYGKDWPYQDKALHALQANGQRRVADTIARLDGPQQQIRVATDRIVADLSAGFWVSLLGRRYEQGLSWRRNLRLIFPHLAPISRVDTHETCVSLLTLRNRVAHHEPIFQLELPTAKANLDRLVGGMCHAASGYVQTTCTFQKVWADRPPPLEEVIVSQAANEAEGTPVAERPQAKADDLR